MDWEQRWARPGIGPNTSCEVHDLAQHVGLPFVREMWWFIAGQDRAIGWSFLAPVFGVFLQDAIFYTL